MHIYILVTFLCLPLFQNGPDRVYAVVEVLVLSVLPSCDPSDHPVCSTSLSKNAETPESHVSFDYDGSHFGGKEADVVFIIC